MWQRHLQLLWIACTPWLAACDASGTPVGVGTPGAGDTVTVMTYNIFHDGENARWAIAPWPERRDAVVATIRARAPDVVGLQEAEGWQVEWLLERMPEYSAVARGAYQDPNLEDAETVAILYLGDRFELRESGHFWYSETPDVPGSFGSVDFGGMRTPRMATWVRLEARGATHGNGLYVFNTHLIADGGADDPELARFRSAELLLRRIEERRKLDAHFVVSGDLNTAPGEWPLRYLLGERCESGGTCPTPASGPALRMIDTWAAANPGETDMGTRCNAATGSHDRRVDHVLIWNPSPVAGPCDSASGLCQPAEILGAEIVDRGPVCPSDHRPVVTVIVLPDTG